MRSMIRDMVVGLLIGALLLGPFAGAVVASSQMTPERCIDLMESSCQAAPVQPGCSVDAPACSQDPGEHEREGSLDCGECLVFCCVVAGALFLNPTDRSLGDAQPDRGKVWSLDTAWRHDAEAPEPPPPDRVTR